MNSLNSVLIEGVLTYDPQTVEKFGKEACTFRLVSTRYTRKGNEIAEELSYYDIEARTKVDMEKCMGLSKGRGVRVVVRMMTYRGRDIDGVEWHRLVIVSETLEIKPKFDRKPSEVQS